MKTLFIIMLSVVMYISCTETPVGPEPIEEPVYASPEFNISGKVMTRDGKPVSGASAYLKKYKLNATTDNSGKFNITGKILAKTLADTIVDTLTDTVVVSLDISETDSIIITESPVTSGVIFELPPSYIIQRNISGSLAPDDTARVGKIEAVVYDIDVPDQKKHIELWHDKINEQFNSFAYFSADTGKTYILYVDIYDTASRFIGRSPDFKFTDKTGDINFKNPFVFDNATPTAEITGNAYLDSISTFNILAKDLHGSITYINIKSSTIDTVINCNTDSINFDIVMLVNSNPFTFNIILTDSDNNTNTIIKSLIPYEKVQIVTGYVYLDTISECEFKAIISYKMVNIPYKFGVIHIINNTDRGDFLDFVPYNERPEVSGYRGIPVNKCDSTSLTFTGGYILPRTYTNSVDTIIDYNHFDTNTVTFELK